MNHSTILAIDLAKNVFQICKMDRHGKVIFNKEVSRTKLIQILTKEKEALVAIESCSSANYCARLALSLGHKVKAIAPRKVIAFRQGSVDERDVKEIKTGKDPIKTTPCCRIKVSGLPIKVTLRRLLRFRALPTC